jgi:hypothetical protein
MAKEHIFVADDFGMNDEINEAILRAHLSGDLNGASLMMAQPFTEDAVAKAHAHPTLQIGWHLHLNDSLPASVERWPWGASPARAGFSIGLSSTARKLMRREVARQWELFQATGLECRFINSHHHLHAHPFAPFARRRFPCSGPRSNGSIWKGDGDCQSGAAPIRSGASIGFSGCKPSKSRRPCPRCPTAFTNFCFIPAPVPVPTRYVLSS